MLQFACSDIEKVVQVKVFSSRLTLIYIFKLIATQIGLAAL